MSERKIWVIVYRPRAAYANIDWTPVTGELHMTESRAARWLPMYGKNNPDREYRVRAYVPQESE